MPQIFDLATLNGSNGFTVNNSGNDITRAGDMNGDGFDDLLVAAGSYSAVSVSVFFSKGTGFSSTESLYKAIQDKNTGMMILGLTNASNEEIFVSSSIGDINGDHIDDIIVGDGVSNSSYVVFGKNSFASNKLDVHTLNGTDGFRLQGEYTPRSASDAGDVNGDGYDDLIIGLVRGFDDAPKSSYVVFGKASGFGSNFDMTSLDGTNGFRLDHITSGHFAHYSVSSAGDVNGDGFADVIIGGSFANINGDGSGSAYVVFGKASGFDAVVNLDSLDGTNGFAMHGLSAWERLGNSVSSAGDVNGDGFGDILIGAGEADHNGEDSGSVYVIFGKSTGFSATLDLANLTSDAGFRIDGLIAGDRLGYAEHSVSSAGDINNDGFDDLMIANDRRIFPIEHSGYVIFGRSDFFSNPEKVIKGTNKGDTLVGTQAAERFEAGNGNDTINGKGGADTYHAGNGNDLIRISDLDFKLVDGGRGNKDTLAVAAVDANLDLSKFSGKITGIEKIYLYGLPGSDSGVTLNATQLKALSDTSNKLIVNGNHGDYVHITDDGWQDKGIYNGMHTYTNADAQLLVGVNVMVDFV